MRINDMVRVQGYDVSKLVNSNKNAIQSRDETDKMMQVDKYTPSNTFFIPPNWNHMLTKSDPVMSDEDFIKAIQAKAREDAANGVSRMNNPEVAKMRGAFVSVASPDRKAAYAQTMAQTGGKLPINQIIYDSSGQRMMHYSPNGLWLPRTTQGELSRLALFNNTYNEAYAAYEAEHGKVQVT